MPFGIPSEDFHGGFGLPHDDDYIEECIHTPEKTGAAMKHLSELMDKHRVEHPEFHMVDAECESAAQEAHDNLVRPLVEAGGEIRELRELLSRAYQQILLLGYDSGFTNQEIADLTNDIQEYFKGV